MSKKTTTIHGGDLDVIERIYNIPRNEIINFSGNINPFGISPLIKKNLVDNIDMIKTYPDVEYSSLREKIAAYVKTDTKNVLVGNGSTELISLFIRTLLPKRALIIAPAYSEYERGVTLFGGDAENFPLKEEDGFDLDLDALINKLDENYDMLIICNPNNPTGTAINNTHMRSILKKCKSTNTYIMLDEAYAEFAYQDNISSVPLLDEFDNLFIIRGTAKFFATPGIRLGYALCTNQNTVAKINSIKDPWSVTILASLAGEVMFTDTEYINKTKEFIDSERRKIYTDLKSWPNIKVYKTQSNFILFRLMPELISRGITSQTIFESLLKEKMLIRDASSFMFLDSSYLRFCFLETAQNQMLIRRLKSLILKD